MTTYLEAIYSLEEIAALRKRREAGETLTQWEQGKIKIQDLLDRQEVLEARHNWEQESTQAVSALRMALPSIPGAQFTLRPTGDIDLSAPLEKTAGLLTAIIGAEVPTIPEGWIISARAENGSWAVEVRQRSGPTSPEGGRRTRGESAFTGSGLLTVVSDNGDSVPVPRRGENNEGRVLLGELCEIMGLPYYSVTPRGQFGRNKASKASVVLAAELARHPERFEFAEEEEVA